MIQDNRNKHKKFYGTWGSGHLFENHCIEINAENMSDAREAMFWGFGEKFCTTYGPEFANDEWFSEPLMKIEMVRHTDINYERKQFRCLEMNGEPYKKPFFPKQNAWGEMGDVH